MTREDQLAAPAPRSSPDQSRRRGRRWPVTILAALVAFGKVDAWRFLLHHGGGAVVLLGVGLVTSVLRTRPVGLAFCAAALGAFAIAPGSLLTGVGVGVGAFVLLLVLFAALGTILIARQPTR